MPISLLPQSTRLFWLQVDKDIPLSERPVFECNAPTRKVILEWSRLHDEAVAINEGPEAYDKLHKMIELGVCGVRNFGGRKLSREMFDEVLSNNELIELAFQWPNCFKLTQEDRVNFTSPPESGAPQSAQPVPARVTIRQPKKPRSSSKRSSAANVSAKTASALNAQSAVEVAA